MAATPVSAPSVLERAIDRPAIPLDHIQRGAVIAPKHPMPMPRPIRPNGNPPRIVKKRVSKKSRRRIKLVTFQGPNLHRRAASSPKMLTSREQGDLGELSAMEWLASQGASIAFPSATVRHWDFIAELDGRLLRVQVKSCIAVSQGPLGASRSARAAATKAGTGSSSASTRRAATTCSCSSATAAAGSSRPTRRRADAASRWAGRSTPSSRSSEGEPIPGCADEESRLYNRLLTARGDVRVAKGDAAVNRLALPTQVRILLPPFPPTSGLGRALRAALRGGVAALCRDRYFRGRGACAAERRRRPRSAGSSASSCRACASSPWSDPRRCCRASASRRVSCASRRGRSVHRRPDLSTEPRLCFFGIRSLRAAGGLKV